MEEFDRTYVFCCLHFTNLRRIPTSGKQIGIHSASSQDGYAIKLSIHNKIRDLSKPMLLSGTPSNHVFHKSNLWCLWSWNNSRFQSITNTFRIFWLRCQWPLCPWHIRRSHEFCRSLLPTSNMVMGREAIGTRNQNSEMCWFKWFEIYYIHDQAPQILTCGKHDLKASRLGSIRLAQKSRILVVEILLIAITSWLDAVVYSQLLPNGNHGASWWTW